MGHNCGKELFYKGAGICFPPIYNHHAKENLWRNMQNLCRKIALTSILNTGPSCCRATELTTAPVVGSLAKQHTLLNGSDNPKLLLAPILPPLSGGVPV